MNFSTNFSQIALKIIKAQEPIIGDLAWDEARKVNGLNVNQIRNITFIGDESEVINRLIMQYAKFFGKASFEICKESVQDLIDQMPTEQVPSIFKKNPKFSEDKKISEKMYEQTLEIAAKLEKTQNNLKVQKIVSREAGKVIDEIERELKR